MYKGPHGNLMVKEIGSCRKDWEDIMLLNVLQGHTARLNTVLTASSDFGLSTASTN